METGGSFVLPMPSARATKWGHKTLWDQDEQPAFLCLAQNHFLQEGAGSWGTSAESKGVERPDQCNRGLKPARDVPAHSVFLWFPRDSG